MGDVDRGYHEGDQWSLTMILGIGKDREIGIEELEFWARSLAKPGIQSIYNLPISPATSASKPLKIMSHPVNSADLHSLTTSLPISGRIGVACFQFTASRYCLPAERGDAPSACSSKYGWVASKRMNRCPTEPVQPNTPMPTSECASSLQTT